MRFGSIHPQRSPIRTVLWKPFTMSFKPIQIFSLLPCSPVNAPGSIRWVSGTLISCLARARPRKEQRRRLYGAVPRSRISSAFRYAATAFLQRFQFCRTSPQGFKSASPKLPCATSSHCKRHLITQSIPLRASLVGGRVIPPPAHWSRSHNLPRGRARQSSEDCPCVIAQSTVARSRADSVRASRRT